MEEHLEARRLQANGHWVPGQIRADDSHRRLRLAQDGLRRRRNIVMNVLVQFIGGDATVGVLVGVTAQPEVQPVAEQRLLHLLPDHARFLGLRAGQRVDPRHAAERAVQILGGNASWRASDPFADPA